MTKWLINKPQEIPSSFSFPLHPLIVQLLFSRGIATEKEVREFVDPNYETDLNDPFLFKDMEKVIQRLKQACDKNEKVVIYGDYDADGITASIIMKEAFDKLGIDSYVYIPDKHIEGYGINVTAVDTFKEKKVSLIVTVDCGITNITEIKKANSLGIDVIITDHHHVPKNVPPAYAIINPHSSDSKYPFRDLAGVGVAFKVVQAIYQKLIKEKTEQTKWMLDLVAIGTIADCVPLTGENRLFTKFGLLVLTKTRRVGLKELFKVGRIIINENVLPDTRKVSFYVAPRINAAGRIKHANLAFDLVFEKNIAKARELALEIEDQNSQRQKMTDKITDEIKLLAQSLYKDKKFIFAIGEHFPVGILGLVAGKIAQKFNKPTAIFQESEDICMGSFRSIPKLNIIETIEECKDLLVKFGGHAQAAGVSVKKENVEKFYTKIDRIINKKLKDIDLSKEIEIDGEALAENINYDLVEDLEKLKPFGEGNREPVFLIKNLNIKEKKIVGNGNKHIKLFLTTNGSSNIFESICFNGYEKFIDINEGSNVDILCNIQKDEWNGNKKIQLSLVDMKIIK
ncbi:MAG TPA: single-stranded-DNA-specific exonuclease RecJ [Candidatus Moranbacteria bacterium]|nr:single-stranded-DNA-specific exonuclease RecJ [Candidatus Moranbacteria bacterium]HRZ33797.1 single-stranded-DNA-specific exonuclease RecJ [Candidatus Moranbacteria bacterium]